MPYDFNARIHALCELHNGEQALVFAKDGTVKEVHRCADLMGIKVKKVLDWYNEAEAEASGLDEY